MIRYDIDFEELERAVDVARPTWRRRAAMAVKRMRATTPRAFDDSGPSWSEIKHLYIARQFHKCAYCERALEAEDYGLIEHDVEHYRPKRAVQPWSPPGYTSTLPSGNAKGYCMLAYELRNYCAACKTCNSALKASYFPIAGHPGRTDARDIPKLNAKERPLLPYPLGRIDKDPEHLITFVGFLPTPRPKSGHERQRARVTIDRFALDKRLELIQARSRTIRTLWLMLRATLAEHNDAADRARAREQLALVCSGREPHTSCARAFVALFEMDESIAKAVYEQACDHLVRSS